MGRLLGSTDKEVKEGVPVIRPLTTLANQEAGAGAGSSGDGAEGVAEGAAAGTNRAVTVPSSIEHSYIACVDNTPG